MASADGIAPQPLTALQQLRQEPHRFSLFAALRLLELLEPARPRLGESRRPADDVVRLEQPPHLTFAPSDVAAVEVGSGGRLRLTQYGFGMFGPNGALPFHLTEYVFERRRHHEDAAVIDFINLFQHRLTSLFYRAWADSDPVASHARRDDDDFAAFVGALVGLFDESARDRDSVPDYAKLCRAGQIGAGSTFRRRPRGGVVRLFSPADRGAGVRRQLVADPGRTAHAARRVATTQPRSAGQRRWARASWQRQGRFEVDDRAAVLRGIPAVPAGIARAAGACGLDPLLHSG